MIEALKPYARQSATGLYWLPHIPSHWAVVRSKHVFAERAELARAGDIQLSATQAYGVIPQAEFERRVGRRVVRISMHLDKRSHVEEGDFVISMRSFQGGLERAWASGAIRSSYVVLRPAREVNLGYFTYLFKAQPYIKALQATGNFIRDGQDLTFGNFSRVDLPVPPRDEQIAIARFLDHANRRINQFISAKKRLIALLNEQKQVIIHRAVTRGLDPSVPLKESGVPWLGAIPEHWQVPLNQRIFKEQTRPHYGRPETQLSLSQQDGLVPKADLRERSLQTSTFENWKVVTPGDLVLNRFKAHLGVFFAAKLRGIVSFHYGVFAPRVALCSEYFELLFHTAPYRAIYAGRSNGMTVGLQNLSNQNFYCVRAVQPPEREQRDIVAFCRRSTAGLDRSIAMARREIVLLNEYRDRLHADVVTGQLDVRAAATALPDLEPDMERVESSDDDAIDIEDTEAA
jgi:type I restriction enzyme S subunit